MAVLVTSGSGVIGLHVARQLAQHIEVVVAYSTSGAPPHAELVLGELADRVRFEKGNILDFNRLRQVAEERGVEGIVHTAALTGEAQARGRPHDVFAVNVSGTSNVLDVARLAKMRRVVYLGSASDYGRRADLRPIREEETNPEGMYAETKFLGHRLGQRYRHTFGLDVITVRVSSAYGPNTRFNPFRKRRSPCWGVGQIGMSIIQVAKLMGARVEFAVGRDAGRLNAAREIGVAPHWTRLSLS